MNRTAVLNVVGLSRSVVGEGTTPAIHAFLQKGHSASIVPPFPAVTCTAQSDYVTGKRPSQHGVVANGWYNRELAEVQFWKQSNHIVRGPKVWDELRAMAPGFTCAKLFWWYNMYATVDYSITPRPMYPADGRKVFDIYTWPYSIRPEIKKDLGDFPFPAFWGPAAGATNSRFGADAVSQWIARSAEWIEERYRPTLSLVYLPHLDYNLQRLGPKHEAIREDFARIDRIVGGLIKFFEDRGVEVILLSEYGITPVSEVIHLNRLFREKGWVSIKEELGLELLDCGACKAFAVADHQVAHVYINDPSILNKVRGLLENQAGIQRVLDKKAQMEMGLFHERSGDLVAVSAENAWFSYYYWLDDSRAPDFARCIDIHRKPGYDPVELFLNPDIKFPALKIAAKLLRMKLGFRTLMDLIPVDAGLVKGSHGCVPSNEGEHPLIGTRHSLPGRTLAGSDVYSIVKQTVLGDR